MSKNLTRKGLALGAIVALGSSLFAGAPAFAGSESAKITLAPAAGTTYTTLIGASYDFKNELDPTIKSSGLENKNAGKLTFLVSNSTAQTLNIDLIGTTNAVVGDSIKVLSGDTADFTGTTTGETAITSVSASSKKFTAVIADAATQSTDTSDIGVNTLRIGSSTDSTEPFSVSVQAFIDDNSNGEIDTFELTSPVRTLNFIKASAATVTTTVSSAVIGTSTIQGKVVIGNDVNNASLVGQVSIGFFKNGTAVKLVSGGSSIDTTDVQWDTTDSVLINNTVKTLAATAAAGTGNTVTAAVYTAKAYFGVARDLIGTESASVSPVAGSVTSADFTDEPVSTSTTDITGGASSTSVRAGYTGAVSFATYALSTDSHDPVDAVKIAGIKIKVTLTKGATFSAGHTVTAGGVTLTSTSGAVSYETTTDATGKATFTASSNKGTDGESYVVKVQVLTDSGYEAGDENTVTFAAATVQSLNVPAVAGANGELSVAKGGSVTLAYDVRDNFGGVSAVAGTYRVSVSASSVTGGGSVSGTAAVSAGKASFSFTDNTITATGKYTVTGQLQKLNSAGTAYDDVAGKSKAVVVNVGTAAVAGLTVPADATSEIAVSSKDFVSHDLRLDANSKTYSTIGLGTTRFTVSGTATNAAGSVVPGASVTISAPAAQFVVAHGSDNDALLATETVTVRTDSNGAYSVYLMSHTAGDVKITVTSGSVTKTVTAKFAFPTTANKDSKLAITGASTSKAGRSSNYVVSLTDKWGNAIKGAVSIAVEQAGAGYLASTPTAVSATNGKANLTLITQSADAGLTTLTVTYDVASPDADIVLTKNILVGVSATVSKAATSKVSVKNASGLDVKVVRGSKSVTKVATSDKYAVSLKGGTGSVKVYVENILVATK